MYEVVAPAVVPWAAFYGLFQKHDAVGYIALLQVDQTEHEVRCGMVWYVVEELR